MEKLYCKDVFWPEDLNLPTGVFMPHYTRHARRAALDDRYGVLDLPQVIDFADYEVIEAATVDGKVWKVVLMADYDDNRAIRIVVIPNSRKVLTVWSNRHDDLHSTIDASRYAQS